MTSKTTTTKLGSSNHFSLKGLHDHGLSNDKLVKFAKERIDKHMNYGPSNATEEGSMLETRNSEMVRSQLRNSDSNLQMQE